eukprot:gene13523-19388_t
MNSAPRTQSGVGLPTVHAIGAGGPAPRWCKGPPERPWPWVTCSSATRPTSQRSQFSLREGPCYSASAGITWPEVHYKPDAAATKPEAVLMKEGNATVPIGEGYKCHVSSHINFLSSSGTRMSLPPANCFYGKTNGPTLSATSTGDARSLLMTVHNRAAAKSGMTRACQAFYVCASPLLRLEPFGCWECAAKTYPWSSGARHISLWKSPWAITMLASLEQIQAASKPKAGMPNLSEVLQLRESAEAEVAAAQEENAGAVAETTARVEGRLSALLSEVESMVRALQLVSVLVEAMGDQIRPHLGLIAGALPKIWEDASSHITSSTGDKGILSGGGTPGAVDTGAIVRLHSALIAVLTHLVGKLRSVAVASVVYPLLQHATNLVASVVYPLLQHATNLGGSENELLGHQRGLPLLQHATNLGTPESECLVEEAFRLWNTTICSSSCVAQPLLMLLPNLERILRRGKDNAAAFPILESYLLLGAAAALTPLSATIQSSLLTTVQQSPIFSAGGRRRFDSLVGHCPVLAADNGATGTVWQVISAVIASTKAVSQQPGQAGNGIPPGRAPPSSTPTAFSPEAAQEAMAASALADVMLQLFPTDVPQLLLGTFKAMAGMIAHPAVPASGVNVKVVNVMEGFLEWLTVASTRFLEEILGGYSFQ